MKNNRQRKIEAILQELKNQGLTLKEAKRLKNSDPKIKSIILALRRQYPTTFYNEEFIVSIISPFKLGRRKI